MMGSNDGGSTKVSTAKILVVDDDVAICKSICVRLNSHGYKVDAAHDGVSATQKILGGKPDLVILDLSMPAGDGHAVLSRLRENPETMSLPVIVLTASKKPGLREQTLGEGADAYFEKPFEAWDLLRTIDRLLD